jgi:hypothetical protein
MVLLPLKGQQGLEAAAEGPLSEGVQVQGRHGKDKGWDRTTTTEPRLQDKIVNGTRDTRDQLTFLNRNLNDRTRAQPAGPRLRDRDRDARDPGTRIRGRNVQDRKLEEQDKGRVEGQDFKDKDKTTKIRTKTQEKDKNIKTKTTNKDSKTKAKPTRARTEPTRTWTGLP